MLQKVIIFFTLFNFVILLYLTIMTLKMKGSQNSSCNKRVSNTNHVYKVLLEGKGNVITIDKNKYQYTDDILKRAKTYFIMENNIYIIKEIKQDYLNIIIYMDNAVLNLDKGIYLLYFV